MQATEANRPATGPISELIDVEKDFAGFPHCLEAHQYARDIATGKIPACQWTRLACRRQLDDLHNTALPYVFDARRGERIVNFMEKLHHVKGDWARRNERIRLEPWQKFAWVTLFAWVDARGLRRFLEAYVSMPRKNAKSTQAAEVGLYCFTADDEFGAEVYCGATSDKQAREVFHPAKSMVKKNQGFREHFGIDVYTSNLSVVSTNSKMEPLTGNPGDGASPSCVIVDEFHEHRTPDLYDTMITGMGARSQPLVLIITTSGTNLSSPCYIKEGQAKKALDRSIPNERIFVLIYTIDEEDDWTTEEAIRKANPNLGVSVSLDYLAHRQREAMQSAARQNAFKTKHLNIWCGASASWMNIEKWRRQPPRRPLEELRGRRCFVAIDMASKIDIAAMVLFFPPTDDDPLMHVHGKYYLPEDFILENLSGNASHYDAWAKQGFLTLTDGEVIDQRRIVEDLREIVTQFDVEEIPYDPREMAFMSAEMIDEGLPMVEFPQTTTRMSEPMKQLEMAVYSEKMAHGNCPVLTWMASNVVVKTTNKLVHPAKERDENKIDGIVALIMDFARWMFPDEEKDPPNPYNDRGLISA